MSLTATATKVYWAGSPPTQCQLDYRPIRSVFIDGAIQGTGSWGILCPGCHRVRGIGTGIGRGQVYEKQADGRFLKTVG